MCLYIKKLPELVKKQIICYKVVEKLNDNHFKSYYTNYLYTIGGFNDSNYHEIKIKTDYDGIDTRFYVDEQVFHSFVTLDVAKNELKKYKLEQSLNKQRYSMSEKQLVIVQCLIPCGSLLFEGKEEQASTSICIDKELCV